jgi:3'-phosphoadenosine 5'-phosphosulfate sulfotransferase (PAPS reductase)/FAD synthetase
MEYPETEQHVRDCAERYGAELWIARAPITPLEQWEQYGWPMLGKMAARKWMQRHRKSDFRCDVSSCCRRMKIAPARKLCRQHGVTLQITGQRGNADDRLRGLRAHVDGVTHFVKTDNITLCDPLTGWTDLMIQRYSREARLPQHPAKERGAMTIGCMFCGGGAQFDNSGFRVLRATAPAEWRRFVVDWQGGEIITAIKYDISREQAAATIKHCGGLAKLADERPWVFDFLRQTPLVGYVR